MKSFIVKVTKIVKTSVNLWLGFIEIINLFRFKKDLQTVKNLLKPKYVLNDLLSQKNTISLNLNLILIKKFSSQVRTIFRIIPNGANRQI